MYDLIAKKRDGGELSREEIAFWLGGCLDGSIPDYQTAAMLMAIYFRGMTEGETFLLTEEIVKSGEQLDLSALPGVKADKHSTGGVGDKTTLIAMPLAAAEGLTILKMSGRSLGKTGGTADKLESVAGFRLTVPEDELFRQAAEIGLALISQSRNLTPADKRLYALRDMTATVDSLPLIAASVMSKKLAAGAEVIVLDVKFGSGAFMPDAESAVRLAELMVKIGTNYGRRVSAFITSMEAPLGAAVGNALEVWEAAEVLRHGGAVDLLLLSQALAAEQLYQGGLADSRKLAFGRVHTALSDGRGWQRLLQLLQAQGGDTSALESGDFLCAPCVVSVLAPQSGFVRGINASQVATLVQHLGAGRMKLEDEIDHRVGVWLDKKPGDTVQAGDRLAQVYAADEEHADVAVRDLLTAYDIADVPCELPSLIYGLVDDGGFHAWNDIADNFVAEV
jgi:pyrimidine-nucleoside phosphorylase